MRTLCSYLQVLSIPQRSAFCSRVSSPTPCWIYGVEFFPSLFHLRVAENLGCLGPEPFQVKVIYSLLPSTPPSGLSEPSESYMGCFKHFMESQGVMF